MMRCWVLPFALAMLLQTGCEKAKRDMYDQPKYKPLAASTLFADGKASRAPPQHTVEYSTGTFSETSSGREGTAIVNARQEALLATSLPHPLTAALLKRGENRYEIFCVPCHSPVGDGDGLITRRGFPSPPSFHIKRLREIPDRHFFDVMSQGYGMMYSYADRIEPQDRWAIVAYIRALQLSQDVSVSQLSTAARTHLTAQAR